MPTPLLIAFEHEQAELELELLIREARRRQRRRRLRVALAALLVLGAVVPGVAAVSVWEPGAAGNGARGPLPAGAAGRCPATPARSVSNGTFTAPVIGSGRVRLGIGNTFLRARRRVLVYHRGSHGWGGIEAIWIVRPQVGGPIVVRGVALGKRAPIAVRASDAGVAPAMGPLTLPGPSAAPPAPPYSGSLYAGSLWVRAGGCYALDISGRGFSERLVLGVVTRAM